MKGFAIAILGISSLFVACRQVNRDDCNAKSDAEYSHTVYSDDSLVLASWRDTGEGGTAPDITAVVRFKTGHGQTKEEYRPLLTLISPEDEYGHHEIQRIVNIEDEYGRTIYYFFLRAKVGSNEYAHDIAAFMIDGDSLLPVSITDMGFQIH